MTGLLARRSDDDRLGDPRTSPFRSPEADPRLAGALDMVHKRVDEISMLEAMLGGSGLRIGQRRIAQQRLTASRNNLRAWTDYIKQHTPHEKKAVIIP